MPVLPLPPPARATAARSIAALVLREISARHGRTPGGYLWALLEPLGAIALLTVAFSLMLRAPPLGGSFALFYATGYLPFALFMALSMRVALAIRFSRPLLAYPRVSYLDALIARGLLALLTQITLTGVVLGALLVIEGLPGLFDPAAIALALAMGVALGAGVGIMNCFAFSMSPVWESAWQIAMRPLILVSGVLYLPEDLPAPAADWLWWNPLVHVTAMMRRGFYASYDAQDAAPAYVFGLSAALAALGLIALRGHHRHIVNERF